MEKKNLLQGGKIHKESRVRLKVWKVLGSNKRLNDFFG